ncbi:MAG TPA: (2Fe-2S) ferredoxin domain-containing protein [Anaerolineales bacterium]|nr:(2Fe-2S) ferredoxin domain-containing protein [Anaerolineales bacterium]
MKPIRSLEELNKFREEIAKEREHPGSLKRTQLTVGMGSCGIAAGALDVWEAIETQVKDKRFKHIVLAQTGCMGLCSHEPTLEVAVNDAPKVTYGHVTPEIVRRILQEHVLGGNVVEEYVVDTTPFPTI